MDADEEVRRPQGMKIGARGNATRQRLLAAAEQVFLEHGYFEASVTKITMAAGVSQGTFYTYFLSKQEIFEELVMDLNRRLRHELTLASDGAPGRLEAELRGFEALVAFTEKHPALYRVIRQAEFVAPATMRRHYQAIASGYQPRLEKAQQSKDIFAYRPDVLAWILMGIGEMVAMRWSLWEEPEEDDIPLSAAMGEVRRFLLNALNPLATPAKQPETGADTGEAMPSRPGRVSTTRSASTATSASKETPPHRPRRSKTTGRKSATSGGVTP